MFSKSVLLLLIVIHLTLSELTSNFKPLENEKISQEVGEDSQQIEEQSPIDNEEISQIIEEDKQKPIKNNITLESCGLNHLKKNSIKMKIVNGKVAQIGQFPYQVMLRISKNTGDMLCGGSLISERMVLTAAHCVTDYSTGMSNIKSVLVTAGAHNRKFVSSKSQVRFADCVIIHEKWKGDNGGAANDIALLRIPSNNPFNITHKRGGIVNTVCLPPNTKPPFESTGSARISGWGVTATNKSASDVLRFTDVGLISDEKCRNNSLEYPIIDSMLCQGIDRTSPCYGDSGGPLVAMIDNRYTQIGIVSFGPEECANDKDPNGVYTQVSYFMDWIMENIDKNIKNAKCSGTTLQKQ